MTRSPDAGVSPPSRPSDNWTGQTYYGRPQLKPAPFKPEVVGGYVFLAGLSGAAALLGAIADAKDRRRPKPSRLGKPRHGDRSLREQANGNAALVRRSRYLSLLAPTLGSALLIYDLHTPKRFYNMLRVAKRTSPMSIGTWILVSFSAFAGLSGAAQAVADLRPRWRWPRRVASLAQIPAGVAGAGLSTYTAALISATSTPLWAAAPREHAMRFGASSIVAAAGALSALEASPRNRRVLDDLLASALAVEVVAGLLTDARYHRTGISAARDGAWSKAEKIAATGLGTALPLGLLIASRITERRPSILARTASLLAMAGSATMRITILGEGMASAKRPEVSMRFAQPDNLPSRR